MTSSSVSREPRANASDTKTVEPSSTTAAPKETVTASTASLKPLPEPSDSFQRIRQERKVFVDKTSFIRKLIDEDRLQFVYLTRPQRFGKSLFLEMLREFLMGNSVLFEGTAIFPRGNEVNGNGQWNRKYPVIFIDFESIEVDKDGTNFLRDLRTEFNEIAASYGLIGNYTSVSDLISDLWKKNHKPVSVIVDNYDYPLRTTYLSKEGTTLVTEILRQFYIQILARKTMLRLVFVMGISKLDVLGNGGSRFEDLTFNDKYNSAVGFTTDELFNNSDLKGYMSRFSDAENSKYPRIWEDLEKWYGRYRFTTANETKILNPTSTCQCLSSGDLYGYAVNTELLNEIRKKMIEEKVGVEHFKYYTMKRSELKASYNRISDNIPLHLYLLCNGYLTIRKYDNKTDEIILGFPNNEIEQSVRNVLPRKDSVLKRNGTYKSTLEIYLEENNLARFVDSINDGAFRELSHTLRTQPMTEYTATNRIRLLLKGAEIECEEGTIMHGSDGSEKGDIDIFISTKVLLSNYVIEIKYEKSACVAVMQLVRYIIEKEVAFRKAIHNENRAYLVGMNVGKVNVNGTGTINNEIKEWICIPYEDDKMYVNKMTASDVDILSYKLRKRYDEECRKNPNLWSERIVWD